MLVVPKQKEFIALKVDYTPEFFIELGKYLDKKYYEFKKNPTQYRKILYLKYSNDTVREVKIDDYILFDKEDKAIWAYVEKEVFDKTYLILKEEEND